eukprot:6212672-Pleurochrysis_carterae.AAC.6
MTGACDRLRAPDPLRALTFVFLCFSCSFSLILALLDQLSCRRHSTIGVVVFLAELAQQLPPCKNNAAASPRALAPCTLTRLADSPSTLRANVHRPAQAVLPKLQP